MTSVDTQRAGRIKFLGYYQIAGGALGLAFWAWMVAHVPSISGIYLLIIALMALLEGFSIYCGRLVLRHPARGLRASAVNQALQTITFAVNGYAWKYVAGAGLVLGIDLTAAPKLMGDFTLSNLIITINREHDLATLGVNVVAVYFLLSCNKLRAQLGPPAGAPPPQR